MAALTKAKDDGRKLGKVLLPNIKHIIAVGSGKGGVGKSTISVGLAYALSAQGQKVGLLDADTAGPSVPTMTGTEKVIAGVETVKGYQASLDPNRLIPVEASGLKCMSWGYWTDRAAPAMWRGLAVRSAMIQFTRDTEWGDLDVLVIDLPPGSSDTHMTLLQTVYVSGAVVVTTPQRVAVADARRCMEMLRLIKIPMFGVVENMSVFRCGHGEEHRIFGKGGGQLLADEFSVPVLGTVPLDASVMKATDAGRPLTKALEGTATGEVLTQIGKAVMEQVHLREQLRKGRGRESEPTDMPVVRRGLTPW